MTVQVLFPRDAQLRHLAGHFLRQRPGAPGV